MLELCGRKSNSPSLSTFNWIGCCRNKKFPKNLNDGAEWEINYTAKQYLTFIILDGLDSRDHFYVFKPNLKIVNQDRKNFVACTLTPV